MSVLVVAVTPVVVDNDVVVGNDADVDIDVDVDINVVVVCWSAVDDDVVAAVVGSTVGKAVEVPAV